MNELHIGKEVRIKDNVFGGDEDGSEFRGKIGEVAEFYPDGCVTLLCGSQILYVTDDEIEDV